MKKHSLYSLLLIILIFLTSCGTSFKKNSVYASSSGRFYIKFLNDHQLEWQGYYGYPSQEYEYVIEDGKIRTTRRPFGQVEYIRIVDKKTLQIANGTKYYLK